MASTAFKSILCGCIVLVFGIVDVFSAIARSTADDDKSVALLQQHLCRDECGKKVCNHHYHIDSHMFCLFFWNFFFFGYENLRFPHLKCNRKINMMFQHYEKRVLSPFLSRWNDETGLRNKLARCFNLYMFATLGSHELWCWSEFRGAKNT